MLSTVTRRKTYREAILDRPDKVHFDIAAKRGRLALGKMPPRVVFLAIRVSNISVGLARKVHFNVILRSLVSSTFHLVER